MSPSESTPAKPLRKQEYIPGSSVPLYTFIAREPERVVFPPEIETAVQRYMHLIASVNEQKRKSEHGRIKNPDELLQLRRTISAYVRKEQRAVRQSILSISFEEGIGIGRGGHVTVTEHGMKRWVIKYSHIKLDAQPTHVEYLRKKSELLHMLIPEHIPRTRVIYGEVRRKGFDLRDPHRPLPIYKSVITIQERIHGKTFKAMTPAERADPEVQLALKEALIAYADMCHIVERACISCNKSPNALRLNLDLKYRTDDSGSIAHDQLDRFDSPNAMYDPAQKRVFFIDLGFDEWNAHKEEVYQHLLQHRD